MVTGTTNDMLEYNRFMDAAHNKKLGQQRYEKYLSWRNKHFPLSTTHPYFGNGMPEFIVFSSIIDTPGVRNAFFFSARMDRYEFTSEQYTLAIANCIQTNMSRDSTDSVNIYVDIRPKVGWPNAKVLHMLHILKHIAATITHFYPGRLNKLYVFSTPSFAQAIWSLIRPVLDPIVASKVKLISGYSNEAQPLPGALKKVMSDALIKEMVDIRNALM